MYKKIASTKICHFLLDDLARNASVTAQEESTVGQFHLFLSRAPQQHMADIWMFSKTWLMMWHLLDYDSGKSTSTGTCAAGYILRTAASPSIASCDMSGPPFLALYL